ncbi:MAG: hypothetical protein ABI186_06090, partial [Candidatus Elarobacter sp.]
GMYVYHVPVLGACEIVLFDRLPSTLAGNPLFASAYVVFLGLVTFGVAMLSYELFERRILGLKRYFRPSFAGVPEPAATASAAGRDDAVRAPATKG